ncbi:dihydropteroate synthase [Limnoraphis robusta Tam1]|uniref:Dihydropteroate synthase n=1 Tax=Limnoraphis robusta CCNP1315 TaxID=3110306 RepID=A0ABU5U585_9CYAN|nr:dihydropteroate synthase [Limnoraphis robusta]MEA5498150.1 dihydropteroate synthase [Limnoraphis robusta BA-68 BA1]MEA5522304.1 dihydropteroate synthase [Limnoraphis robusta CCNP1315]MEA5543342.1 dihydropteroate synthase [Limnoraphis robusta Tam1]MEA5547592.1 dihydropteroate synthase [Limnoraphis robusta CCNP1324]
MPENLILQNKEFEWGKRTYIMGVLNVTPDSFSDGGEFNTLETALIQAEKMVAAGVDIIDIGGQSTRPGSEQIALEEELNRVIPVVKLLRSQPNELANIPLSIDTTRAAVAQAAIEAGADLINDISGATFEPEILSVVAKLGVPIVLMHIRGTPKTMQQLTDYQDLIGEILQFFQERIQACKNARIYPDNIILDPGIGFAKTYEQNLEILRQLPKLRSLGFPLLIGPSRKSFIGHILNQSDPQKRVWGTAAACVAAIVGSGDILRVHDVKEMVDVCRVADAIYRV